MREGLALALGSAGHQVVAEADPFALLPAMAGAGALLVDAARGKQAVALLRDRGFSGRSLLVGGTAAAELARRAHQLDADGSLAASPPNDLPARFAAAMEARRRVLVVDDSEIVARLLGLELKSKGFDVHYAPDAETATRIILKRATRPDLVLLDINMPKVNGVQFCRFLKKNDRFRSIKVLFCSGETRERVAALAAECGADGYILKDEFLGRWIVENAG
jgi:CheY-like chemotaxis protein